MEEQMQQMPAAPGAETQQPVSGSPAIDEEAPGSAGGEREQQEQSGAQTDFAALAQADLAEIKRLFPAYGGLTHLTQIDNPTRFAALRDAGLSVEEAFLATNARRALAPRADNRAHLRPVSGVSRAGAGIALPAGEMERLRELFPDLTDEGVQALYRRARA